MDAKKKTETPALTKKGMVEFFGGLKQEFKTIAWTQPKDLRYITKVTVVATFFFGMAIYLVDLAIQAVLQGLSWLAR